MALDVTNAVLGDIPMIVAAGILDRDSGTSLQSALNKVMEARHNVFFLELSDVTHMDGDGLSVVRGGAEALTRGWIGLIGMSSEVRGLMEADGLLVNPRIRLFDNRQAARIATGERAST
jgi:anti-anti-sigma regulatory factor